MEQQASAAKPLSDQMKVSSEGGTAVPSMNATPTEESVKAKVMPMSLDTLPTEFKGRITKRLKKQREEEVRRQEEEKVVGKVKKKEMKVDPKTTVCIYHMAGKCKNYEDCQFQHNKPEYYQKPICKLFHSWFKCRFGKDCVYVHGGNAPDGAKEIQPEGTKMPRHARRKSNRKKKEKDVFDVRMGSGRDGSGTYGGIGRGRERGGYEDLFGLERVVSSVDRFGRGRRRGGGVRRRGSYGAHGKADRFESGVCYEFQKGLCQRGATCKYIHMHEG